MGLFGIMSYDEAMETLIEGAASKSVLEKAYKRIRKNEYDKGIGRKALHYCFGELYGLGIEKLETSAVERDIKEHSFGEDELRDISEKARKRYETGQRLQSAYGTTLIGVMLAENFWLGLQIGDGKCVAVSKDGEFTQPIPWDEQCFLNVTTSICDENAAKEFRFCFERTLPAAVFIGSDGIDDCFAGDERLYDFYRLTLRSFAQTNDQTAVSQLKDYLPTLSEKGSGDDMSVGIIVNTEFARQKTAAFEKSRQASQNEVTP